MPNVSQPQKSGISISHAAKILGIPPKVLIAALQKLKWIFKKPTQAYWEGYQSKVKDGSILHSKVIIQHNSGEKEYRPQVLITSKGVDYLQQHLAS